MLSGLPSFYLLKFAVFCFDSAKKVMILIVVAGATGNFMNVIIVVAIKFISSFSYSLVPSFLGRLLLILIERITTENPLAHEV